MQAEQDFQQLTATVAQLRAGSEQQLTVLSCADTAPGVSSARDPSTVMAHGAVLEWDTTERGAPAAADSRPLREALERYRTRVADLESQVARLRQCSKRQSADAASWRSSSGGSGGTSQDLLLQGLLADSDSDAASRVRLVIDGPASMTFDDIVMMMHVMAPTATMAAGSISPVGLHRPLLQRVVASYDNLAILWSTSALSCRPV